VATVDTEKQLAWEARQRPRAGIAAIVAALLMLGSDIWSQMVSRDAPAAGFLESFRTALQPGPVRDAPSALTSYFQFVQDHSTSLIAATLLNAVGLLLLAWVLTFLVMSIRARRPIARPLLYMPVIGAVLTALGTVMFSVAYNNAIGDFLAGPHTVDRAYDASSASTLLTAQVFRDLLGPLVLAAGWVVASLNAMRVGLLTRFMGIIGVIIGVLHVIPLGPRPVVEIFWLGAFGALCLGYWPSGLPAAWRTGQAEPWPSQAQVAQQRREAAEARRAARGGGARRAPATPPAPTEPAESGTQPAPARTKRKRKRR